VEDDRALLLWVGWAAVGRIRLGDIVVDLWTHGLDVIGGVTGWGPYALRVGGIALHIGIHNNLLSRVTVHALVHLHIVHCLSAEAAANNGHQQDNRKEKASHGQTNYGPYRQIGHGSIARGVTFVIVVVAVGVIGPEACRVVLGAISHVIAAV